MDVTPIDFFRPPKRPSVATTFYVVLIAAVLLIISASCRSTTPSGPVPPVRFVAATRPSGINAPQILQSFDGLAWTFPRTIVDTNGAVVPASSSIGITFDGLLYHATWFAGQQLRYATSANGDDWVASNSSLGTFPVGGQARPAMAAGAGKVLVAFLAGAQIVVVDVASPSAPVVVPGSASAGPGLAFGNQRFVVAFPSTSPRSLQVRTSADGVVWSAGGNLPAAAFEPGATALAFDDGQFQLVQRVAVDTGNFTRIDLETFTSPDGLSWSPVDVPRGVPSGTGTAIGGSGADRVLLDASTLVRSFVGANPPEPVGWTALNGLGMTRGDGRPIVTFSLDTVTITGAQESSGDEPYFLLFSFHSRVARPGSTRVRWSGTLEPVGSDLPTGAVRSIPPLMGATAWTVEEGRDLLNTTTGQVDVMGAVIVAIEEDACPDSGVTARAREAETAIAGAIEGLIATGTLGTLLDKPSRDAAVAAAVASVRSSLDTGSGFKSFFGCATDRDDQVQDRIVIFVGTDLFTEDPPARTFAIDPTRPVLPISLTFSDPDTTWTVAARLRVH